MIKLTSDSLYIDTQGWISVLSELPEEDVRVDVMLVDSTGQSTPFWIDEDWRSIDMGWAIYDDYDCKVVYWKYFNS